jgi:hypothetical protein
MAAVATSQYYSTPSSLSGASLADNPFPETKHVTQCRSRPGGPIKFENNTEWDVNTPVDNGGDENCIMNYSTE